MSIMLIIEYTIIVKPSVVISIAEVSTGLHIRITPHPKATTSKITVSAVYKVDSVFK